MGTTVYVIDPDPVERKWIESVLARSVEAVVCLDSVEALLADPPDRRGDLSHHIGGAG